MKRALIVLLLLVAGLLAYGIGTPQRNSEETFLSDEAREQHHQEKQRFDGADPVIVTGLNKELREELSFKVEEAGGEFMRLHPKKEGEGLFTLPPLDDVAKFRFFETLHALDAKLAFAGGPYTNAELAGMSLKIQDVLFPILFAIVFAVSWLLLRHFPTTLYLFLSSLLGVGVGLSLVRALYGAATILTTLTPLVGFVLTLGVQLHVIYGLSVSQSLAEFWREKLKALLIMMITTLVGFFSLYTSDLASVRQLAISAGLTLLVTWTVNFSLLRLCLGELKPRWFALAAPMMNMKKRPVVGYGILAFLSLAGVIALKWMPVQVEALYFFPTDHRIQVGARAIGAITGGTPQFEVLIKRKDGAQWGLEDTRKLEALERASFPARIVSAGQIARTINKEYLGEEKLPDTDIAFTMLLAQAPPLLGSGLITEAGYKWIVLAHPQRSSERGKLEAALEKRLKEIPSEYEASLGGITYWLLKSQGQLVQSLLKSFGVSLLVILVTFAAFERKPRAIVNFAVLNVASILAGFALMGVFGFELNVSSIMTASIALGLVVDSTIHLMFMGPEEHWVRATYHPIVLSHVVIFVAFLVLALEPFVPIRDFALGLTLMLAAGLACDLWVLPLIEAKGQQGQD